VRLSLGGQSWPELEFHAGHGELTGGEGEGGEEAGGLATGALGRQGEVCRRGRHGDSACSWLFLRALFMLNVSRKQQAGRRRREGGTREEKEKEGKEKNKKNENFSKPENFWGEK
jgi:hypothetical protein